MITAEAVINLKALSEFVKHMWNLNVASLDRELTEC